MTKYWIVVNDNHAGPYTADELAEMKIPAETYAWHPGLPKWTQVKDIPELADIILVEEIVDVPENITNDPAQPALSTTPPQAPPQAPPAPPEPMYNSVYEPAYQTPQEGIEHTEKCPPSYLAWSIVTTILFFLPLGIVAILYSAKVNGLWNTGQPEKARRFSEMAAWFSNISFVIGLIWIPFSVVFTMII